MLPFKQDFMVSIYNSASKILLALIVIVLWEFIQRHVFRATLVAYAT